MWRIVRYEPADSARWDAFVRASRNGTFLFEREYMDYHSDRFHDCSWMVFKGDRLLALLGANIDEEGILHSHQGLTYGGWILPCGHLDGAGLLEIFTEALDVWRSEGIKGLDYKPIPSIYASMPSGEDLYALFRLKAEMTECNLSSAINLEEPLHYNKLRRRALIKTLSLHPHIEETDDCEAFMKIVTECLAERHGVKPVHSPEEIALLKNRFPERIRMFTAGAEDGVADAGVMIYDTGRVAHAQYIATTPNGREHNMLTPLFNKLITEIFSSRKYFDFGISNEDHGLFLNEGLLRQKFSYGATGVVYTRWRIDL